ncbi:MAG: hypothetical protein ACYDEQ_12965, partial [Desulfocucumaceae bacterium]
LQHSSEVARAERDSAMLARSRLEGQLAEICNLLYGINKRIEVLGAGQDAINENLRDQALDINLLKKIISL